MEGHPSPSAVPGLGLSTMEGVVSHAELGLLEPRADSSSFPAQDGAGPGTILITWGGLGLAGSPSGVCVDWCNPLRWGIGVDV